MLGPPASLQGFLSILTGFLAEDYFYESQSLVIQYPNTGVT